MLRYLKHDPLEVVLCFPLSSGDEECPARNDDDADEGCSPHNGADANRGMRMGVSVEDVLGSSPAGVLGDDDVGGVGHPPAAVDDSAVWLHQSITGSATDVRNLLSGSTEAPKLVRRFSGNCTSSAAPTSCLWAGVNIQQVSILLQRGTALLVSLRTLPSTSSSAEALTVHGRISMKRPLRSAQLREADDGAVLSYTNFVTGLGATTPLQHAAAMTPTHLTSPSSVVCFDFPDESQEYIVSSAAEKVVCFPSCLSGCSDLLVAVLFRCGRVGCLSMSSSDNEVLPTALSANTTPSGVQQRRTPAVLDMAHVPNSNWVTVLIVTYGAEGSEAEVRLVVVDVPSASVMYNQPVPFGGIAAVAITCTAPVVTSRRPSPDGLEDCGKAFYICVAAAERRVVRRFIMDLEKEPLSTDGPISPWTAAPWRTATCQEVSELQLNVEQSYFADSNIALEVENSQPKKLPGACGSNAGDPTVVETRPALWPSEVVLGARCGRIGHATPSLLSLCSLVGRQSPISLHFANPACLTQPSVGDARRVASTSQLRYQPETILFVLWPQCVMVVDPSLNEGANIVAAIETRSEDVYFTSCWTSTFEGAPLVHLLQEDGAILTYQLCRRHVDSHSAPPTSFPIDCVELVSEVCPGRSILVPLLGRRATAAGCALVAADVLADGSISPSTAIATSLHEPYGDVTQSVQVEDPRCASTDAKGGASLRIVDVGEGRTPMLLVVFTSGLVTCSPLGGGKKDYIVMRCAETQGAQAPTRTTTTSAAITSATLLRRDASSDMPLLITGHKDGTVEVWCGSATNAGRCVCLASTQAAHRDAVEGVLAPVLGASAFLRESVSFLSVSPMSGTLVLHGTQSRHFSPLRRLSTPHEPVGRILWDTSIDLVVLEGRTTGTSNFWFAQTGRLERTVSEAVVSSFTSAARINLIQLPVQTPLSTTSGQAAACVGEYTNVSFVDHFTNVLQTSLTPLITQTHAEVTAYMLVEERDRYRFDSTSPSSASPGASPASSVRIFSARVALALFHCFAIPDIAGSAPGSPQGMSKRDDGESESPFTVLCAKLLLPRHVHPPPRRLHIERLLRRSGAQTTRIFIFLLALLRVLEPLAGRSITQPCVAFLLTHLADVSDASRTPPASSPVLQGTPTSGGLAPLALPCVATCVPYALHPLIAVQEAAHATMSAVVRRLSPVATVELLRQAPPPLPSPTTAGDVSAADHRCLGRVVLAVHATRDRPPSLRLDDTLSNMIAEVANELSNHLTLWATSSTSPTPSVVGSAAVSPLLPNQPIVLSVFADAWLAWQAVYADHGDAVIDLVFGRCVANTSDCPEYRFNHGARALVDIAGQDFSRFINCVERWFARIEWRTQVLQLLTRVIQKYPAAMLVAFPTAMLHFAWLAIDPHAPHRSALRDQLVGAVSSLLKASVNVLPNVAFHQSLQYLITGHDDGQVFVYDVKSTRVVSCFQSHSTAIACVAFHAGHTQDIAVLSASLDVVRFWRMGRSHSIMGLLSIGGGNCHVTGALDVPVTRSMRKALDALPNKCMTADMIASSCRLSWLSPSCVELQTPWHDRIQLLVQ